LSGTCYIKCWIRQLEEDGCAGIAVFQMKEGEEAAMSDYNEVGKVMVPVFELQEGVFLT